MNSTDLVHPVLALLARRVLVPAYGQRWTRFERQLQSARQAQRELLLNWIERCRDTRFGCDFDFAGIRSVDDFRRRVPIAGYDAFKPYIDAVARGEQQALFPPEERVERFTITTGSTGVPKWNPVTPTWLREYRRSWDLWGAKLLYDHLHKVGDKILQIVGSYDMGRTPGGIPISMVSALLERNQRGLVRSFYAIPHEVTDVKDPESRYYAIMRLGLAERIGLIVLMNPGSLIRLAQFADTHRESLIRDIRDGTLSHKFDVPETVRTLLARRIRQPNKRRAGELERIVERTGRLYPRDYWPEPMIACWIGGTAGYQSRYLAEYFGNSPLRDQGLVSSEGRHTIPFEDGKPEGVLAINNGFYEFVPVNEIDSVQPTALEGHELEIGRDYYIVMTTYSGYFRFNIGDIVRCRGFRAQAPILEFLQKGERCGDLEGEKITEHQFLQAAAEAASAVGLQLSYVTVVPTRRPESAPCYEVFAELADLPEPDRARRFLVEADRRLCGSNFLYNAKRREGVLGPLRLRRIQTGGWQQYMQAEIDHRGTGEAHYKHPGLVQDPAWVQRFDIVDEISMTQTEPVQELRSEVAALSGASV